MYKIRLNDGTEYPVKYCAASNGEFRARLITGAGFLEIAAAFSDAAKTRTMYFVYDKTEKRFDGYTDLKEITVAENGDYIIALREVN